jgi:hypothetical protein
MKKSSFEDGDEKRVNREAGNYLSLVDGPYVFGEQ